MQGTYAALDRDLLALAELKILIREGKGHASKYVLLDARAILESSDNLPARLQKSTDE